MRTLLVLVALAAFAGAEAARADYASTILGDNPAAYYRFDEASAPVAFDSSPNGYFGLYIDERGTVIAYGQPGAIVGDPDTSVGFTGQGGYVRIDNLPTPIVDGNDYAIEFWVMTTADGRQGNQAYEGYGLIHNDIPGGPDLDWSIGYVRTLHDIDLVNVVSFTTGEAPDPDAFIQSQTDISDGVWHHVVCVRVLGVEKRICVDGRLEATGDTGTGTQAGFTYLAVGGNAVDNRYFTGNMDEVVFYNYALASDQILNHYLVGTGQAKPGSRSLPARN